MSYVDKDHKVSALLHRRYYYEITAEKCIQNWIILSLCKILSFNQQKYKEHRIIFFLKQKELYKNSFKIYALNVTM